ncbi:hypothetical protein M1328_02270 [Patescibacteria group bacterium]|nr:hypothetical protein [Patescibacteria group bacterium]
MTRGAKREYYFSIGGFYFNFIFYHLDEFTDKEKLEFEVVKFFQNFRLKSIPSKIDYQIDIVWDKYAEIRFFFEKKDDEYFYINYFINKSKNKTVTFYRNSLFEFNVMLRLILSFLLRTNNGFFVHASAVAYNDKADIFLGKSGAGKSTVRQLLDEKYLSLADDVAILKKESKKFYIYQFPFLEGKTYLVKKTNKKYLLNRVIFIDKADNYKLIQLTDKKSIIKLMSKQLLFDNNPRLLSKELKNTLQFVTKFNRFYKLKFARDKNKLLELIKDKKYQ